jgi:site-specific recombinase XerD
VQTGASEGLKDMQEQLDTYISQRSAEGLAPPTIKLLRYHLSGALTFLRARKVNSWQEVCARDLDALVESDTRFGLTFDTRQNRIIMLKCFFRWLAKRGLILTDPARHLMPPDPEEKPLLEPPLSEDEVAEIIAGLPRRNVIDLRNIAHIELLYSAGLRKSESLLLNTADIDFANGIVRIRKGKGSKPRDVPMMKGLQGALKDYLCLRRSMLRGPDHGALLLDRAGKRIKPDTIYRLMGTLNRKRGPKKRSLHPHLFRHSIAVHLLRGGADTRCLLNQVVNTLKSGEKFGLVCPLIRLSNPPFAFVFMMNTGILEKRQVNGHFRRLFVLIHS